MKTNFEELKKELIEKVKEKNACASEYKRALASTNKTELLKVISDNLNWCIENQCVSHEYFDKFSPAIYAISEIANTGKENTGYRNSGNSNSGYSNSGNRNSGYRNSGNRNSGDSNSGDSNSGDSNSGNSNSGDSNSGDSNSGDSNSGHNNSGNKNSGDWNSGNSNSGDSNSGNSNSGYSNSGNWNSGNRNSGDSNSGYRNSGAFCTNNNPTVFLFDKKTNIPVREWENSRPYKIMANNLNFTFWINSNEMTEQEKKDNPKYETAEGYLKTISHKEGWANMWGNLSETDKSEFIKLPNFDAGKFEEITGIKI